MDIVSDVSAGYAVGLENGFIYVVPLCSPVSVGIWVGFPYMLLRLYGISVCMGRNGLEYTSLYMPVAAGI